MTADDIQQHAEALQKFVDAASGQRLYSTGYSKTTSGPGQVYNVRGSTDDPHPTVPSVSWVQLLVDNGITWDCNASAPLPAPGKGPSHPKTIVGGHMTTDANGHVATGGSCYLMPLCKWHNQSTNTALFTCSSTTMLILTGYMKADLAATFLARLGGAAPYGVVYLSDVGPTYEFHHDAPGATDKLQLHDCSATGLPEHHVVMKREIEDGTAYYTVAQSSF